VDDVPISTPVVRAPILAGQRGVIEGMNLEEAQQLAIELNSGALPLSIRLVQESEINPTLGEAALEKGVLAGTVGLGLVLVFMVLYYKVPGVIAALALTIYAILMLAVFKVFPITLTISGLAGFVLSIGMAVDANVLIFERMREELRAGRSLTTAIEIGFDRAWSAILDGNLTTLLVAAIMFVLASKVGGSASFIMGFAVTLFIGVVISMFTAVVVTRLFLRLLAGTGLARRVRLFNA
jgi:preprotein translocase subunit SecD